MDGSFSIAVAALSDIGCVRINNEDNYGFDLNLQLYVVCDGMGGAASGEIASAMAVSTFIESFSNRNPAPSLDAANKESPPEGRLYDAILRANYAVFSASQVNSEYNGMGTTLVAAHFEQNRLLVANVGDSRAYIIQRGQCMQITMDHSYENEAVRAGYALSDLASTPGMQSVITRAIGIGPSVEPDFVALTPLNGDTVLLATDGLTRYIADEEIAQLTSDTPLDSVCSDLVSLAKQRGGIDNITCLALRFKEADQSFAPVTEERIS